MSDTKLRDLERRWKETGAVDDEAAYLLERVRVGNLTRERLELAAYCGHRPSMTATNTEVRHDDLHGFVSGLERFGPPVLMSAGLAMGRACLPLMGSDHATAVAALEEKEALVRCPCPDHRALNRSHGKLHIGTIEAGSVIYMACQAPVTIRVNERGRGESVEDPLEAARQVVGVARLHLGEERSRRAICETLVSEALSGRRPAFGPITGAPAPRAGGAAPRR